ncbi:MAG TPA: DNA ligase D, partial [Acidimicrobiales bacterium]|nr:DNA ligase D [Acidimicrobiales bacterium]
MIQEHHARSLHWDLRLEHDGVLASWALPKGLPDSPAQNHLAVHTEDHPLEYAEFEGEIPQGEYGGGLTAIWDSGRYDAEKWTESEVKFVLHGTRAAGSFVLFRTEGRNWMIHRHGASVRTDPLPSSVRPMLAVAGGLPDGADGGAGDWAYEVKWDGIRAILFVEGGRVRARSRNDLDLTASFPEVAAVGEFLGMTTCVLDGEIVALGEDGRPSFSALQHRMQVADRREARRRAAAEPVTFVAFDVLYLDGHSLVAEPYDTRRARLESLHLSGPGFTTTDSFTGVPGRDVLAAAEQNGLEGVVAKQRSSPYRAGRRHPDWVKVKAVRTQEVVIGGWTEGRGERRGELGALLLGMPDAGGLRYVGKVGTGFGADDRRALLAALRPLARRTSPFQPPPPGREAAGAHFVRPDLVGEVSYGEWTSAGRLRHPVWRGLRADKAPVDVVVEAGTTTPAASSAHTTIAGRELSVSNLDKVLFPRCGFTKGQLIDYYVRIAPAMLPHLKERPLTMKRFPDGVEGKSFFEKHIPAHAPDWVRSVDVPSRHARGGAIPYVLVDDVPALAWAANLGAVELHVPLWHTGRRRSLPAPPDHMVFDLDPGAGTSIVECCMVAGYLRAELARDGTECLAKTSGSKGLQLYAAVGPHTTWEVLRARAHGLARKLETDHRDLVVSNMRRSLRQGR